VKSTATSIGQKYNSDGRFRVWKGQTRSLIAADANAVAWYAFVLLDEENAQIRIQRKKPSTVNAIVQECGGGIDLDTKRWGDGASCYGRLGNQAASQMTTMVAMKLQRTIPRR